MIEWRLYRTRPGEPKQAHLVWQTADYHLSWGTQRFDGPPHARHRPRRRLRRRPADLFRHPPTHPEPGAPLLESRQVRAYITIEPVSLTTSVNGSAEMIAIVPIGAVVVQNPSGEEYAMTAEEFERRYMLDE
jgi:hypothetical protein